MLVSIRFAYNFLSLYLFCFLATEEKEGKRGIRENIAKRFDTIVQYNLCKPKLKLLEMEDMNPPKNRYLLLYLVAFLVGLFLTDIFLITGLSVGPMSHHDVFKNYRPIVFAESQISHAIEDSLSINIPDEATNLYYSWEGVLDIHESIALSLPTQKQCEEFIEKQLNIPLTRFVEEDFPIKNIYSGTPSRWPEKYQGNWDLKNYENLSVYSYHDTADEETGASIYYFPEASRIFVLIHSVFSFNLHLQRKLS